MEEEVLRKCVAFNMLTNEMIKDELLKVTPANSAFGEVTNVLAGEPMHEGRSVKLERLFRCFKREWPKPTVDYKKLEKNFFNEFFGFYLENHPTQD